MTAATVRPLLSVEQWRALGEDTSSHAELQEGVLIVSPRPRPEHQDAVLALGSQLRPQVPRGMRVSPEIDIADAGIPHYWIVDLDGAQVRLEALTLVDGAYRSVTATGEYAVTVPFDVRLDLAALV